MDFERDGGSDDRDGSERIPVKSERELIAVSRRGAGCYRFEKTMCGKKACRCTRGELHGPYWYAYYRENGRMRSRYIGKNLPERESLLKRAAEARERGAAERARAVEIITRLKETIERSSSMEGVPRSHRR